MKQFRIYFTRTQECSVVIPAQDEADARDKFDSGHLPLGGVQYPIDFDNIECDEINNIEEEDE